MKKIEYFITAICACIYLVACSPDMGNYNYKDNKIQDITGKGTRSVALGDTIKITPIIKWKYPDKDTTAFEYRWELNDSVISKERNLRFVPTRTMSSIYCNLFVTDKVTGVVNYFSTTISVSSIFEIGWTILSEKSGKSILSYIRKDEKKNDKGETIYEYVEYKDIYKTLFGNLSLGNNPKRLHYLQVNGYQDEILVIQDPKECVYLSGEDFSKRLYLKEEFPDKQFPNGFIPKEYIGSGSYCNYLLGENGQIYWRIVSPQYPHVVSFMPIPLYQEGGLNVPFFPSPMQRDVNIVYMYDNLNKRLIARYTGSGRSSGANMQIIQDNKPNDVADITNLGNYKLSYMGGGIPNYLLILKDTNTGEYVLHSYRTITNQYGLTIQITNHFQQPFTANAFLSDKTKFLDLITRSYLFFGEGSKLYFYDKNTKRVKLYHDFGAGNIVKLVASPSESEISVGTDDGNIYFCDTDVRVLALDHPGAEGGMLHHTTGLGGKVVDIIWKYGGY